MNKMFLPFPAYLLIPIVLFLHTIPCAYSDSFEFTVQIPLDPRAIEVQEAGPHAIITGRGMDFIGIPGTPSLPAYTERVALPTGCSATAVDVVNSEYQQLRGYYDLAPHQPPFPLSMADVQRELVLPDPEIYGSSSSYPLEPVEFGGSSVILGIPVAYLRIFPVRWNPASRTLEILSELTLRVTYESDPSTRTVSRRSLQSENRARETVMNCVVNPDGVSGSGAAIVDSRELQYGEYVIIATPEYQTYAQELAQWKTSKGIPTWVCTTEWIESCYSFYDLQQNIRAFLTDCRDEGVEFVLIYGDDDVIPGRDVEISDGGSCEYPPVDLYWADINDMVPGTDLWDSNNNNVWGEYGEDQVDYHPDLWVGRASVNEIEECEVFNGKVLAYEQVSDVDYFDTAPIELRIGYSTGFLFESTPDIWGCTGGEMISQFVPWDWDQEKCYEYNGNNSVTITRNMIDDGPHHVYHASHGNKTMMYTSYGSIYNTSHIMAQTNIADGGLPAIWNSISCLIGHLDDCECCGDAWLNSPEGGGFGAFNARYGWGSYLAGMGPSEILSRYFYDVMWNDDQYMLGVAHLMGSDEMMPPTDCYNDWCVKEYNLFGDPEIPMWYNEAVQLEGSHATSVSGVSTVTVSVTSDGSPVEGARVCLQKGDWKTGDIYMVENTDAAGQCDFFVEPSSTGTITVVAWARDHICYRGYIEVTGTGFQDHGPTHANQLGKVCPSPAFSSVTIPFSLAGNGEVRLDVYDLSGRLVTNLLAEEMSAGSHNAVWELSDQRGLPVPSGFYAVRISSSEWTDSAEVLVIR